MKTQRQGDLVDEYTAQLIADGRRVDDFVTEHRSDADECIQLLQIAFKIHHMDHPTLPQSAKDAGLKRVISSSMALRSHTSRPRVHRTTRVLPRLQQMTLTIALVVALLGATVGTAFAAEKSLPGDTLYPIKIASEQLTVALASAESNTAVKLWIAERRTSEIEQLMSAGDDISAGVLDALESATMAAATSITAGDAPRVNEVQRLAHLTTRQNEALLHISDHVPASAKASLERARATSEHALTTANRILHPPHSNGGYPIVPPGQENKLEDPTWEIPPGLENKDGTPPGQQQRNDIPPGLEGKDTTPPAVPPGQEKKEDAPPGQEQQPPGQEKKDEDPASEVPPGLEDKGGEPPGQQDKDHSPPGQEDKDK